MEIQFSISTHFSSILPIDRTLSGATSPNQSGPGRDGNKGVLPVSQSASITGTSPTDCLVSYAGHSLERGFYPSTEKQLAYSTALADWASFKWSRSDCFWHLHFKKTLLTNNQTDTPTYIYIYIYICLLRTI